MRGEELVLPIVLMVQVCVNLFAYSSQANSVNRKLVYYMLPTITQVNVAWQMFVYVYQILSILSLVYLAVVTTQ